MEFLNSNKEVFEIECYKCITSLDWKSFEKQQQLHKKETLKSLEILYKKLKAWKSYKKSDSWFRIPYAGTAYLSFHCPVSFPL